MSSRVPGSCPGPAARPFLAAALAVVLAGCSSSKNTTRPTVTEHLGTPITSAGALGPLLWSGLTNEIVFFELPPDFSPEGLRAVHAMSGAQRTLVGDFALPLELAPGGVAVYYLTFDSNFGSAPDSIRACRVRMTTGAGPDTLASAEGFGVYLITPAPDGDQVAIEAATIALAGAAGVQAIAPGFRVASPTDSIVIHRLSTGTNTPLTTGIPLAFSPTSDQLLVLDGGYVIAPLDGSATRPAGFVIPEPHGGVVARWGTLGPEALYLAADQKRLYMNRVDPPATTLIWTSPDTLHTFPLAWSADGLRAALWSSRPAGGTSRTWELHAVDLVAHTAHTIAITTASGGTARPSSARRPRALADILAPPEPDALVFSPDGSQVAYTVFDGRIYRSDW